MKRFVCLLLVAMLALSLSVAVFARYEVCPDCHGRLSEGTYTTTDNHYDCGDENCNGTDRAVTKWGYLRCSSCGYEEEWEISTTITYRH